LSYYLAHITYPVVFLAVLGRQLCLPIPALLFLLSGGALAGAGKLSYSGIMLAAVLGCVLADWVWFEAGRRHGKRILRLLCALATDPSYCVRNSREVFARKGVRALVIAKFIPGLDGLCPPLAGMTGASHVEFLLFDSLGSALWAGAYVTFGYFFARELDKVVQYTSVFANVLIVALGAPLLAFFLWRLARLMRIARLLLPMRITVDELQARIDSGESIGIVDLLRFEDDPQGIGVIPGAIRLDPRLFRRKKQIIAPPNLDVVVYCSSKNSFVSTRVAATMRKHGLQRIRVLTGGLNAWKAKGLPLDPTPTDSEVAMERLGIQILAAPIVARRLAKR
jgi:membrane protein DedA with SNARE-associated domain/rhodanese-related sulfurtransferase